MRGSHNVKKKTIQTTSRKIYGERDRREERKQDDLSASFILAQGKKSACEIDAFCWRYAVWG